jgi:hypothetical protein
MELSRVPAVVLAEPLETELWQVPDQPSIRRHRPRTPAPWPKPACWVAQNYTAVFATGIVSALPPSAAQ